MSSVDDIFVISFYNNENRIKDINNMQKKFDKQFKIITPISDPQPHISILKTHLKIWLENINKNIIILEDDFLTSFTQEQIYNSIDDFLNQNLQFDFLLLGGDVLDCVQYDKYSIVNVFIDSHAVFYNKNSIDKLFKFFSQKINEKKYLFDIDLSNSIKDNGFVCYSLNPLFFTQSNNVSYHTGVKNDKYDSEFNIKQEVNTNTIYINSHEFNENYFHVDYKISDDVRENSKISIFATDLNSGIRHITHEMNVSSGCSYFTRSGRNIKYCKELFLEIFIENILVLRKKFIRY